MVAGIIMQLRIKEEKRSASYLLVMQNSKLNANCVLRLRLWFGKIMRLMVALTPAP
jgi:hypothetical protein